MGIVPDDAIAMYSLIMRDLKNAKGWGEKRKVMRKFAEIRNRCLAKQAQY
jgi:hypothetical protein